VTRDLSLVVASQLYSAYVPIDISGDSLHNCAAAVARAPSSPIKADDARLFRSVGKNQDLANTRQATRFSWAGKEKT
jgi:hypothetical protein